MEKSLDPQLWNACAGNMVQLPSIGTNVFYFPQGHAEHANTKVDFSTFPKIPSMFFSRISSIRYLADSDSDEVFAKIILIPLQLHNHNNNSGGFFDDEIGNGVINERDKPASFAKTLTQSDANNGGGFSVPRYCAETIFPKLDYSADPPVQTILAKDVHGEIWKFRHIYRGTPRRHLLTTGWSNFVNHKKLVAGDSIVFLRAQNGELCVGVRRAKRGIGGIEPQFGWNPAGGNCDSPYGDTMMTMMKGKVKVTAESVVEAVKLALLGKPFEIVYYPRACTPEFCVKASVVSEAMRIPWCCGMRFKMPFETEDSSRISWFMGTVSAAQIADPVRWPNSPWRLLQVAWDEPELLQNVKRVSPWLVEVVSNMPAVHVHLNPFSPPRKKMRFPLNQEYPLVPSQHPEFHTSVGHYTLPPFAGNFLRTNNPYPSGLQGARHGGGGHFGLSSIPVEFQQLTKGPPRSISTMPSYDRPEDGNRSCSLTMGRNIIPEKIINTKAPALVLFGQAILTKEQMSQTSSDETFGNTSSDGIQEMVCNTSNAFWSRTTTTTTTDQSHNSCSDGERHKDHLLTELKLETGHSSRPLIGCSILSSSYNELHSKLTDMFGRNGERLDGMLRTQLATNLMNRELTNSSNY